MSRVHALILWVQCASKHFYWLPPPPSPLVGCFEHAQFTLAHTIEGLGIGPILNNTSLSESLSNPYIGCKVKLQCNGIFRSHSTWDPSRRHLIVVSMLIHIMIKLSNRNLKFKVEFSKQTCLRGSPPMRWIPSSSSQPLYCKGALFAPHLQLTTQTCIFESFILELDKLSNLIPLNLQS